LRRFSIVLRHAMLTLLALGLAGTGLIAAAGPAQADGGHNGSMNIVASPEAGLLHVRGWVYDYDAPSAPVRLHLYVGGIYTDPNAQFIDLGVTDVARPDVPNVHPEAGPTTGFDRIVEVSKFGDQQIFLYALNAAGDGALGPAVLVSGTTVRIENPNPLGEFTSVSSPVPGQVTVAGFAFEYGSTPERTRVAVTTNGAAAGTLVADQKGPGFEDFAAMFNGTVPSPGGDVRVCVTAVDQGVGSDQSLGCRQVQVAPLPVPVPVPPPVVVPPPAEPRITLGLRAVRKKSRLRIDVGPDLEQSNYRLKIQRQSGKRWRTVKRTQTLGVRDRITVDLRRGKYRVVVPSQHGMAGARAEVRLKR
jgi:hypothetical protein